MLEHESFDDFVSRMTSQYVWFNQTMAPLLDAHALVFVIVCMPFASTLLVLLGMEI